MVLQLFAAVAALPSIPSSAFAQAATAPIAGGYGTDPDMMKLYERGMSGL